jgi:hypothetical protein
LSNLILSYTTMSAVDANMINTDALAIAIAQAVTATLSQLAGTGSRGVTVPGGKDVGEAGGGGDLVGGVVGGGGQVGGAVVVADADTSGVVGELDKDPVRAGESTPKGENDKLVEEVFVATGVPSGSSGDEFVSANDSSGVEGLAVGGFSCASSSGGDDTASVTEYVSVASDRHAVKAEFNKRYVKTAEVRELKAMLEFLGGRRIPGSAMVDIALARYTAATMPDAFRNGKAKLKALAAVGDAACASTMLSRGYRLGKVIESMQRARGMLTDAVFARAFSASPLASKVSVGAGVNLANTVTGATALEAFAGVLSLHCGPEAVLQYLVSMKIHEKYDSL